MKDLQYLEEFMTTNAWYMEFNSIESCETTRAMLLSLPWIKDVYNPSDSSGYFSNVYGSGICPTRVYWGSHIGDFEEPWFFENFPNCTKIFSVGGGSGVLVQGKMLNLFPARKGEEPLSPLSTRLLGYL